MISDCKRPYVAILLLKKHLHLRNPGMYAFIDESGNTGPNMFDPGQPIFYSAAVISRVDIDQSYADDFARIAKSNGAPSLHAAEMGVCTLEKVLPEIQRMIKRDNIRFFIGEINKRDLVLIKLVDALFDVYDNPAVPWHIYNVRSMRLMIVMKMSVVANEDCLKTFWSALMEHNADRAEQKFKTCLRAMQPHVCKVPDARSQDIIGEAIQWALDHPGAITIHSQRSARLGHLPHLVVFPSALGAVQRQSEFWKQAVIEIRHDRESLVAVALKNWHDLISNAPVTTLKWVDMTLPIGGAPGSKFKIASSKESAGIQLADITLWLIRREKENGSLGANGRAFLKRVRQNWEPFELSLNGVDATLEEELTPIMTMPMTETQFAKGRELLIDIETKRQKAMADFDQQKNRSL